MMASPPPSSSYDGGGGGLQQHGLKRATGLADEREMAGNEEKKSILYDLCNEYMKNDVYSIQRSLVNHVEYTVRKRQRHAQRERGRGSQHKNKHTHTYIYTQRGYTCARV